MTISPEPESQPGQPKRSSILGLVSSIFGLLTIVYTVISNCGIANGALTIVEVLSAIAILMGGIDLYLRGRKIPLGAILALITVLAFFLLENSYTMDLSPVVGTLLNTLFPVYLIWGISYAVIQINLVIKKDDAKQARLGIALALLCTIFVFGMSVIVVMIMGQ